MRYITIRSIFTRSALAFIAILLFTGGCATAPQVAKKRLFFPAPPVEPKVEWKGTYRDQHNFPKSDRQRRVESLLGRSPSIGFTRPMDTASDGKGLVYVTDPDSRNVYIYDLRNHKISVLDQEGEGMFTLPIGIAVDMDGRVYVADRFKKKILVFGPDRKPLFSFGGAEDELGAPVGVAVDNINKKIYVSDVKKHTVNAYDMNGKLLYVLGEDQSKISFNFPVDVDVLPDGTLIVADTMNAKIQVIDSEGNHVRNFGKRGDSIDAFEHIKGLAVDTEGHIYITDVGSNSVKIYDVEGRLLLTFGGTFTSSAGIAPGGFAMIAGISADSNNGIFIADQMNKAFQVFQYLDEAYLSANPLPDSYSLAEENKTKQIEK